MRQGPGDRGKGSAVSQVLAAVGVSGKGWMEGLQLAVQRWGSAWDDGGGGKKGDGGGLAVSQSWETLNARQGFG